MFLPFCSIVLDTRAPVASVQRLINFSVRWIIKLCRKFHSHENVLCQIQFTKNRQSDCGSSNIEVFHYNTLVTRVSGDEMAVG